MVKIGCCGFPIGKEKYYKVFKVVEIQKTFYTLVSEKTLQRWRIEAPEEFEFTIKASQLISHPEGSPTYRRSRGEYTNAGYFRDSSSVWEGWKSTKLAAKILKVKFIVFQTPPSFSGTEENIRNLENFFQKIDRDDLNLGWEERGEWDPMLLKKLKSDLNLVDVVDPFKRLPFNEDFVYFRLHGIGGYRYKFCNEDFQKIKRFKRSNGYIMFNNIHMLNDAKKFLDM